MFNFRLPGVSASASDRDIKDSRSERQPSTGSVGLKESEAIPRRPHDRNVSNRDKISDHGSQMSMDRDDVARRDHSSRRPSDSELQQQQRQERRHHHHNHASPAKDNGSRHGRVQGTAFCSLN